MHYSEFTYVLWHQVKWLANLTLKCRYIFKAGTLSIQSQQMKEHGRKEQVSRTLQEVSGGIKMVRGEQRLNDFKGQFFELLRCHQAIRGKSEAFNVLHFLPWTVGWSRFKNSWRGAWMVFFPFYVLKNKTTVENTCQRLWLYQTFWFYIFNYEQFNYCFSSSFK